MVQGMGFGFMKEYGTHFEKGNNVVRGTDK